MARKRARTAIEKKDILLRLYKVWISGDNEYLRLGQLLSIVFEESEMDMDSGETKHFMCLFGMEDYDLIEEVEKFFAERQSN